MLSSFNAIFFLNSFSFSPFKRVKNIQFSSSKGNIKKTIMKKQKQVCHSYKDIFFSRASFMTSFVIFLFIKTIGHRIECRIT